MLPGWQEKTIENRKEKGRRYISLPYGRRKNRGAPEVFHLQKLVLMCNTKRSTNQKDWNFLFSGFSDWCVCVHCVSVFTFAFSGGERNTESQSLGPSDAAGDEELFSNRIHSVIRHTESLGFRFFLIHFDN